MNILMANQLLLHHPNNVMVDMLPSNQEYKSLLSRLRLQNEQYLCNSALDSGLNVITTDNHANHITSKSR